MRAILLAAALLAALTEGARAQPRPIDAATLAGLPVTELDVAFETGHGPEHGHYAGPLLWSVLGKLDAMPAGAPKTRLVHSIVVTGHDGYAIAVAFGEVDPYFEGKQVILAASQDGHPIGAGEIRLIVPGDKHAGRAVHDVVSLDVR